MAAHTTTHPTTANTAFGNDPARNSMTTARTDNTHVNNTVHHTSGHSSRPAFTMGSWFKRHGFDILSLAAMGAVALGIHFAGELP